MRIAALPGVWALMIRTPMTRSMVKRALRQFGLGRAIDSGAFDDDMLEMAADLIEVLASSQLLVALGEHKDDLIRRVPPALLGCHGAGLLPAVAGVGVAQHLDLCEGLTSSQPLQSSDAEDGRVCEPCVLGAESD